MRRLLLLSIYAPSTGASYNLPVIAGASAILSAASSGSAVSVKWKGNSFAAIWNPASSERVNELSSSLEAVSKVGCSDQLPAACSIQ